VIRTTLLAALALCLASCGNLTDTQRLGLGVVATTAYLGRTPSNEIEQVYYVGVFDPQDQVPPSIYRLRVRGQASAMSQTRFASGWVPAVVADSIGGTIRLSQEASAVEVKEAKEAAAGLATGRRLMMFGPEGFREAPRDHRLVIVMGSNPEKYFSAIEQSLGVVASATQSRSPVQLDRMVYEELLQLSTERDGTYNLLRDIK
jgi:hypothetical protein